MGKIREFFNLLVIAVLISLSIIFIGAAFREEYPLWKNQKILEPAIRCKSRGNR